LAYTLTVALQYGNFVHLQNLPRRPCLMTMVEVQRGHFLADKIEGAV